MKLPDGSILDYKINQTAQTGERFVVGPFQIGRTDQLTTD
jgi:hypothetical protein